MKYNRGQGHIEYFLLIAVIVGALLAMQVYVKRGMQGRARGYAQQLSAEVGYSPGATRSDSVLTKSVSENTASYAQPDPADPDNNRYITETSAQLNQQNSRWEEVSAFSQEPGR